MFLDFYVKALSINKHVALNHPSTRVVDDAGNHDNRVTMQLLVLAVCA